MEKIDKGMLHQLHQNFTDMARQEYKHSTSLSPSQWWQLNQKTDHVSLSSLVCSGADEEEYL